MKKHKNDKGCNVTYVGNIEDLCNCIESIKSIDCIQNCLIKIYELNKKEYKDPFEIV